MVNPCLGIPSLFISCESSLDKGQALSQSRILEVQAVHPPDSRSWFMGSQVLTGESQHTFTNAPYVYFADGKLLIITPIDPVFPPHPYLAGRAASKHLVPFLYCPNLEWFRMTEHQTIFSHLTTYLRQLLFNFKALLKHIKTNHSTSSPRTFWGLFPWLVLKQLSNVSVTSKVRFSMLERSQLLIPNQILRRRLSYIAFHCRKPLNTFEPKSRGFRLRPLWKFREHWYEALRKTVSWKMEKVKSWKVGYDQL